MRPGHTRARAHAHAHARTHARTHTRARTHARTHTRTYTRTRTRTHSRTYSHASTQACKHASTDTHAHSRTHISTHARKHARTHARTHPPTARTGTHTNQCGLHTHLRVRTHITLIEGSREGRRNWQRGRGVLYSLCLPLRYSKSAGCARKSPAVHPSPLSRLCRRCGGCGAGCLPVARDKQRLCTPVMGPLTSGSTAWTLLWSIAIATSAIATSALSNSLAVSYFETSSLQP